MDFKEISFQNLDAGPLPFTFADEIVQNTEKCLNSESIFIENNPDFFSDFSQNFINQDEQWPSMLMDFAKALVHMKLPYYNEFQTCDIPSILISLIQSSNIQFIYLSLFIIAKLCKSSPKYAEDLVNDSAYKYIAHIIYNSNQKMNMVIIEIAIHCLINITSSSAENRNKIITTLHIDSIAVQVFNTYCSDNIIQAFFLFLNSIYSYPDISEKHFNIAYDLMTKIKNKIGRKHIYSFLNVLDLLSEYPYSSIILKKGTDLLSFLEKSFTDLDINIVQKVCTIITNSLKNGGNICESIIASAITYLHCNNYDIINCANEILISVFIKYTKTEEIIPLNLDIGILIKNTMEGTNESKHSSFDLLVFYLMKRNDLIDEALENCLMDTIIMILDSDDENEQIKAVELAKILFSYDQLTNFEKQLPAIFESCDCLSRVHEILDETDNENLIESIQSLINTYYEM